MCPTGNDPSPEPHRIVVVDEADAGRAALCRVIEAEGYVVTAISSGVEALEFLRNNVAELVVLELLVPDINGWDLLEMIKTERPELPVVVMAGHVSERFEAILTARSASGYLIKPVIPKRLRALFRALLSPHNLGRDAHVLVVDPDASASELVEDRLAARGLFVSSAKGIREALRCINDDPPDLIITELDLGNRSGLDLCRSVRTTRGIAFTPIMILTTGPARDSVVKALELRVNAIVRKPVETDELVDRVLQLLRQAIARAGPGR